MSRKVNITVPDLSKLTPRIEIKDNISWNIAINSINNLRPCIEEGYNEAINKFSTRVLRIVRKSIASGTPPPGSGVNWQPLSKKLTDSHHIYHLTGQYLRAVGIYKYKSRVIIGLPLNTRYVSRRGKLGSTLNKIAIWLEYGTRKIPARPLWRPSLKSAGGRTDLKAEILRSIRSKLIKKTGLKANQIRMR